MFFQSPIITMHVGVTDVHRHFPNLNSSITIQCFLDFVNGKLKKTLMVPR